MAQYYYTVASLPLLQPDDAPPLSWEQFLEICRYTLSDKDFQAVEKAKLEPRPTGDVRHPADQSWCDWETTLRNELVKHRASGLGKEADKYYRESEYVTGVSAAAKEAYSNSSPLEAEYQLNRARWQFLEEMQVMHPFDETALIVYALKLQILLRQETLQTAAGEEGFKALYQATTEKIHQYHDGEL